MVLTVKLYASLRAGRFAVAQIERPVGATVASIVDDLRIPRALVGALRVSGREAELEYRPAEGETISIYPRTRR
jgi:hypothetical protein